ncbi:glycosyltransferase family 2 protein [Anoxybacillus flavithermus]|uniref:glycosyltransferase family 2 protein n=1 Tax=Anoxybacillus flavithermus TaxID=33934 RepID=UPI0007D988AA|nr:glycosyltransferase family 2 protein [Anoxybacillus flavithermus]MBE2939221.1 glycosyltransferase family 2 protein [Anoxybacillus flavithermus]MBE2941808.1 glycosyltransferase family 2 protein [Anoxybacillus flavithermus]MBE2950045.1 glycosyltransferase family 2 protein [Anoxybacillus flavithermus]MBE2952745.1 glycosyltransferase family 2 protein [Anoxybacillus flavithermus]MBE2958103.1 glycosyltransferase family 2 protein [Anoxybacillus flavithermus]
MKVIVFLPAHNEEGAIGDVIRRIPRHIQPNIDVYVLVVDDGSTDRTVDVAKRAGADFIYRHEQNRGLGAAVRTGLQQCVELGADIGVMIDADNEYPPEQIPDLIMPILHGEADYTMGSRFLGTIRGMKWHRRIGNYMFTLLQSLLLKTWIYDGQSGMRAFSRQAMEEAEIIHDYNYAQVLTLNLVRKGFRLKEVPIVYQVRTTGQSFIKFTAYLKHVIPAIVKEMCRSVKRKHMSSSVQKR